LGVEGFFCFGQKTLGVITPSSTELTGGLQMAANPQQGTYLGTTLAGFTAFTGGLAAKGSIGVLVALVGLVLLIVSAAGFYKIKNLG
jgi:hypothetical protein